MTSTTTSTTTSTDPRIERTRRAALEAAYDLLIADGPDAVSHGQVATRANVSRTTVYKHFPTRADLLRCTIEVMGKHELAPLTGDLRTDLLRQLDHLVDDFADDEHTRAMATMLERSQHDPTVAEVRDSLVCDTNDQLRAIIQQGIDAGELCAGIDIDLAMAGLMGTFVFKRLLAGERIDHAFAERVVDAFIVNHGHR